MCRRINSRINEGQIKSGSARQIFQPRFVARLLRHAQAHAQLTPLDLNALEAEHENLIAAVEIAFGLEDWKSVLKLTQVLVNPSSGGLLRVRGYWEEMLWCSERAIQAAPARRINEHVAAQFASRLAAIRMQRGEYEAARKTYRNALQVFRALDSRVDVAHALHQLGSLARHCGDLFEARRLYQDSLRINRELDNRTGIASILHELGRVAQYEARFAEARQLYNESLQISTDLQDQLGTASILHSLGQLAQAENNYDEADRLYEQSLEIEMKLGNQSGIASSLWSLSSIAEEQGNNEKAIELLRQALSIFERLDSPFAKRLREHLATQE